MKTQKPNINPNKFFSYLKTTNFATLASKQNLWHNTLEKHIKYKHFVHFLFVKSGKFRVYTRNKKSAYATAWAVLICVYGFSRTSRTGK